MSLFLYLKFLVDLAEELEERPKIGSQGEVEEACLLADDNILARSGNES